MRKQTADEKGIRTISDLKNHPELKFGVSTAFRSAATAGTAAPPLRPAVQPTPKGWTTPWFTRRCVPGRWTWPTSTRPTPKCAQYDLQVLEDDQHYFPAYDAVLLYRADLEERAPDVLRSMLASGRGDLRGRHARDERPRADGRGARGAGRGGVPGRQAGRPRRLPRRYHRRADLARTLEHLLLVSVSLFLGVVVAVPLGVLAARRPWLGHGVLAAVGAVQTVPALAFLVSSGGVARPGRRAGHRRAVLLQPAADRAQHLHGTAKTSPRRSASRPTPWDCRPAPACI